jgi:hypothetical protein
MTTDILEIFKLLSVAIAIGMTIMFFLILFMNDWD